MPISRSADLTIAILAPDDVLSLAHKESMRLVYSPEYSGSRAVTPLLYLHGRKVTLTFPDGTAKLDANNVRTAVQSWIDADTGAKNLGIELTSEHEESVARPGQPIWQPPHAQRIGYSYRLAWADKVAVAETLIFSGGTRFVSWFISAEVDKI